MKAMTHEQASFWLGTYMDTLKNESGITRRVLEVIHPHDRLDYKTGSVRQNRQRTGAAHCRS